MITINSLTTIDTVTAGQNGSPVWTICIANAVYRLACSVILSVSTFGPLLAHLAGSRPDKICIDLIKIGSRPNGIQAG